MNDAKPQCQQVETGVMGGQVVDCQQVHQVPEPATAPLIAVAMLIAIAVHKIARRAPCKPS